MVCGIFVRCFSFLFFFFLLNTPCMFLYFIKNPRASFICTATMIATDALENLLGTRNAENFIAIVSFDLPPNPES